MRNILIALFLLASTGISAAGKNWLVNGSFTAANAKAQPGVWQITAKKAAVMKEKNSSFLQLQTVSRGQRNIASLSQIVGGLPEGISRISGEIRGNASVVYIVIHHHLQGKKPAVLLLRFNPDPKNKNWQKFSLSSRIPAGKKRSSYIFEIRSAKAGENIFLRDLKLEMVSKQVKAVQSAVKPAAVKKNASSATKNTKKPVSTAAWVARPASAVNVKWPKHNICGKDWWMMLDPQWRKLGSIAKERFVREAGWFHLGIPWKKAPSPRITGITEVQIFQKGKNVASRSVLRFSSEEEKTRFVRMENTSDGDRRSCGWILGNTKDFRKRQKSVPFRIDLELPDRSGVEKIAVHTMKGTLPVIRLAAFAEGKELDVTVMKRPDSITLLFPSRPKSRKLVLKGVTQQPVYQVGDLSPELKKAIGNAPFTGRLHFYSRHAELEQNNIDKDSILRFRKKYPNFFPDYASEISANFYQKRRNPRRFREDLIMHAYLGPIYDRDKYEYENTLRNYWMRLSNLFGGLSMLEGGLPTMPYYYEWGSPICHLEASNERPDAPNRILMLYGRSGSRQYGKPWGFYQTLYGSGTYADSRYSQEQALALSKRLKVEYPGEDFGCSPSYSKRIMYYAYYAGTNMQSLEAEPYGYAKRWKDGRWTLTGHGRAVKDIADWAVKPEGKRGDFYAPILFLSDYYSANWEYRRAAVWNTWYLLPFEDSDYMHQHIIRTIDPVGGSFHQMHYRSPGMRNSRFGDIYDSFFANAPSGNITNAELGKYPVVFILGNINPNAEITRNLQKYVKDGGTLVINSAQMKLIPEKFAGVKLQKDCLVSNDMQIRKLTLDGAECVMKDSSGLPLVTRCRQGKGFVLLTTPVNLLNIKNKKSCISLIPKLLAKLQSEVLPFRIEGDIQFFLNKMSGRDWKLILINNKGTFKLPQQTRERFLPGYARTVTLTLPKGAKAVETRLKLPLQVKGNTVKITVPPGEVAVVSLTDVNFSDSPICADPVIRKPLKKKVEYSNNNPKLILYSQAGEKGKNTATVKKGKAQYYNGKNAVTEYLLPIKQIPMPEGGYSCYAKPETVRKDSPDQVVITNRVTRIEIVKGRWSAYVNDGVRRWNIPGPKAEAGKWVHLAFTWHDSVARFYVNGKETASMPQIFEGNGIDGVRYANAFLGVRGNIAGLYLGRHFYSEKSQFRGLIRDVYFYGAAPTAGEIRQMAMNLPK